MKEFQIKKKHIEYPELLKIDLDTVTRHGYEVVDVEDNKLKLVESRETYNFLIDANNREIRDYFKDTDCGYVELYVKRDYFRPLGISRVKVDKPTRRNANYLLIKSPHKENVFMYRERLNEFHTEEMKKQGSLSVIYFIFLLAVIIGQKRVVSSISIYGYYILSLIIIALFIIAFYKTLKHKGFKDEN